MASPRQPRGPARARPRINPDNERPAHWPVERERGQDGRLERERPQPPAQPPAEPPGRP